MRAGQLRRRPHDLPRALAWASYRLLFMNAPGIVPATGYTLALGWFIPLLTATAVLVVRVAWRRHADQTKEETTIIMTRMAPAGPGCCW